MVLCRIYYHHGCDRVAFDSLAGKKMEILSINAPVLSTSFLVGLLIIVIVGHGYNVIRVDNNHYQTAAAYSYEAALWIDRYLPTKSVVAMSDAGVTGYFAGAPVVNLGGLANSYDYQAWLMRGDLRDNFEHIGVGYIIRAFNRDILGENYSCISYSIPSYLYNRRGEVELCQDQEVFRSTPALFADGRIDQLIIPLRSVDEWLRQLL